MYFFFKNKLRFKWSNNFTLVIVFVVINPIHSNWCHCRLRDIKRFYFFVFYLLFLQTKKKFSIVSPLTKTNKQKGYKRRLTYTNTSNLWSINTWVQLLHKENQFYTSIVCRFQRQAIHDLMHHLFYFYFYCYLLFDATKNGTKKKQQKKQKKQKIKIKPNDFSK